MSVVSYLLTYLGPVLVGIVTVPLWDLIKKGSDFTDNKLPAWAHQFVVALIALGLSKLGALLNTVLPTSLSLFSQSDVAALLSSAIALASKAGQQAKVAVTAVSSTAASKATPSAPASK